MEEEYIIISLSHYQHLVNKCLYCNCKKCRFRYKKKKYSHKSQCLIDIEKPAQHILEKNINETKLSVLGNIIAKVSHEKQEQGIIERIGQNSKFYESVILKRMQKYNNGIMRNSMVGNIRDRGKPNNE